MSLLFCLSDYPYYTPTWREDISTTAFVAVTKGWN